MSLTSSEMTPADIRAVSGGNGWGGFGDGSWWLAILFLFALGGGWGFGGWGNGGGFGGAGAQGALTREDLSAEMGFHDLTNSVNGIQGDISNLLFTLNNGMQNGFNATQVATMQGFNGVTAGLNSLGQQFQNCCCQTQRAIDGINYNMATNTASLQNALCNQTRDIIDSQNAGTRAILDYLCQDKIRTLQSENQALRFQSSQQAQNAILGSMMARNTDEILARVGGTTPATV